MDRKRLCLVEIVENEAFAVVIVAGDAIEMVDRIDGEWLVRHCSDVYEESVVGERGLVTATHPAQPLFCHLLYQLFFIILPCFVMRRLLILMLHV